MIFGSSSSTKVFLKFLAKKNKKHDRSQWVISCLFKLLKLDKNDVLHNYQCSLTSTCLKAQKENLATQPVFFSVSESGRKFVSKELPGILAILRFI